jgi:site-specific DNA-methyltransferase (adenine-specific)
VERPVKMHMHIDRFRNTVLFGDCVEQLRNIPDKSIQLLVTSPPYFKKRKYTKGHKQELGREDTPEEFVEALCKVFDESWRVLRDDGCLFVNIADTNWDGRKHAYLKPQDLCLVPQQFAIAMQKRGWICHNDIIWQKVNPTPVPAFKKCKPSHEYIWFFTKTNNYFFDYIAIREPAKDQSLKKTNIKYGGNKYTENVGGTYSGNVYVPNGWALKKDVWTFTTASDTSPHCAVFPKELPETAIRCGTSEFGCCPVCGTPYVRIIRNGAKCEEWAKQCGSDKNLEYKGKPKKEYEKHGAQNPADIKRRTLEGMVEKKTVGWMPNCSCEHMYVRVYPSRPNDMSFWEQCQTDIIREGFEKLNHKSCIVLDPFGGSGTTGEVAVKNRRDYILIELNRENEPTINKKVGNNNADHKPV